MRFFDGSQWSTVQTWTRGIDVSNNTFYNATVSITPAQYNFAVNSGFRFQCDASGNQDQIFIDQVTITGISATSKGKGDNLQVVGYGDTLAESELDFKLYPNPVRGDILNVDLPEGGQFEYSIKNMVGQTITKGSSNGEIKVNNLESGMYFIEVNDGDEIMIRKFIRN